MTSLGSARLRVLFAGTPEPALPTLRALAGAHEVVAALTRAPARRSRRGAPEPSPVAQAASELGIPVLELPTLRTPEAVEEIRALGADIAVVVAYGVLIPPALLDVPRLGWVNLHFSLLPAWRGAAPVQWSILAGDEVTGASTFRLTAGLDEGPVIGTMTETVRPRDTSGDLLERLAAAGADLVLGSVEALGTGAAQPVEQAHDGVTLAPRIEVSDARVRWADPAFAVDRHVRAMTPAPGAWSVLGEVRVKVGPVRPTHDAGLGLVPGELRVTKDAVHVGTGTAAVRLGDVAPAGKPWMAAPDWARGARLPEGTRFDA